ncbi:MAG: transporter [Butyrivibrio sp.]|nr:transporter [Butyrivibrio sp.]
MRKQISLIFLLQVAVMIYSLNTVIAKFVSNEEIFSLKFFALYFLEFCFLGIYAIMWQQLIKKFELSVAYANKAMTLLWSLLWSVLIFHEGITINKVIGIVLVMMGIVVINATKDNGNNSVKGGNEK